MLHPSPPVALLGLTLVVPVAPVYGQISGPAEATIWIERPEAQPWIEALNRAALRAGISAAVLAEVIGMESGFRNVKNPLSSATGFGQQIDGNRIMRVCRLDRTKPEDSIMGTALELRENLDRTGSLDAALRGYGTTAGLVTARAGIIRRQFAAIIKRPQRPIVVSGIAK